MATHLAEVGDRVGLLVTRTRRQVNQRLIQGINYWYGEEAELAAAGQVGGTSPKLYGGSQTGGTPSSRSERDHAVWLVRRQSQHLHL